MLILSRYANLSNSQSGSSGAKACDGFARSEFQATH